MRKRCAAKTKKGTQCTLPRQPGSKVCSSHTKVKDENRCSAMTIKGERCKKSVTMCGLCTKHYIDKNIDDDE